MAEQNALASAENALKALPETLSGMFKSEFVNSITSRLGQHNPFSHPIDSEAIVWLFDNTAYQVPNVAGEGVQTWQTELVSAFFQKNCPFHPFR